MRKTKIIKRLTALFLTMIFIGLMAGCGTETTPKKETGQTQEADNEEAVDETFGLNDTAVFETLKITAVEMKESEGDDFVKPAEGKKYIGVKFQIENVSKEEQTISSLLLFNAYVDGMKADTEIMLPSDFSEGTIDGSLSSGKSMEGYFVVQAGTDWQELQLDVQAEWISNAKAQFVFAK